MTTDPQALLALAEPIVREVGHRLRTSLDGDGPAITAKSTPTDLVTELDVWAERHLVEHLLRARPDDGVIGEEGADRPGTSGVTWCIDPIDGTVNFVHRLPGFNVSVAALVDGRAVAGIVTSPLSGETFTATLGGGAAVLERYAALSGGSSYIVSTFGALKKAADTIALDIRQQYRLGYDAPDGPPGFHRVEVRTTRKGVRIRTRSGYMPQS